MSAQRLIKQPEFIANVQKDCRQWEVIKAGLETYIKDLDKDSAIILAGMCLINPSTVTELLLFCRVKW